MRFLPDLTVGKGRLFFVARELAIVSSSSPSRTSFCRFVVTTDDRQDPSTLVNQLTKQLGDDALLSCMAAGENSLTQLPRSRGISDALVLLFHSFLFPLDYTSHIHANDRGMKTVTDGCAAFCFLVALGQRPQLTIPPSMFTVTACAERECSRLP